MYSSFLADKASTQQVDTDKTSRHAREVISGQRNLIEQILIANSKFYLPRDLYGLLADQGFMILHETIDSVEPVQTVRNRKISDLSMTPPQMQKRIDTLVAAGIIIEKKVNGKCKNKKSIKTLSANVNYYGPVNGEFDEIDSQRYANFVAKARNKDLVTDEKKLKYLAKIIIAILKLEKKYSKDDEGISAVTLANRTFDFKEPIIQRILDDFTNKALYTEELIKEVGLKYEITRNHYQKYLLTPSQASLLVS